MRHVNRELELISILPALPKGVTMESLLNEFHMYCCLSLVSYLVMFTMVHYFASSSKMRGSSDDGGKQKRIDAKISVLFAGVAAAGSTVGINAMQPTLAMLQTGSSLQ